MPPSWAPPDINIIPGESCGVIIISVFSSCAEYDAAPFFRDDFSNHVDGVNRYVAYLIA